MESTAECSGCKQDIDISDNGRRRRTNIPSWVLCSFCGDICHSQCAEIPVTCTRVDNYDWECKDCKHCFVCKSADAVGMMFCDGCDRGCHGICLTPKVDVSEEDERPFLCQECIEAKHTTRGFRRIKILGCEPKRQLTVKREASENPKRSKRMRSQRQHQRHSTSVEVENESSTGEEDDGQRGDALPHTCVARGCDGSGHLDGESLLHFTLDTCPVYNHVDSTSSSFSVLFSELSKGKKLSNKTSKDMLDNLSTMAENRMSLRQPSVRLAKPLDVFVAPTIQGVSDFGKMIYELNKVSLATKKSDAQVSQPQGKPKRFVDQIQIGRYIIDVDEMSATCREEPLQKEVFFCEICLAISHNSTQYMRHVAGCTVDSPPGMELYSKNDLAVYEVDGRLHKEFCQNLSLLSRFFLSTKAVCYDVIYMMYYVLVQKGPDERYKVVGYFSKDKDLIQNTLACILVLPQYEHQGFGKLLIDLSYVIAKTTHKPGTPERPLSRPGLQAFTSYWKCVVSRALLNNCDKFSKFDELMDSIVGELGMAREDVEDTLVRLNLIKTNVKTKKQMLLIKPFEESLEQHAKKREEWRNVGKLIDVLKISKAWLKVLTTRKQPLD